ncbi:hypothetical protein Cni_G26639 [Canna indica]|uniref:Uncharacterized protein n=1 Tax=Canna indica TaxID=4628 RepID=A0AAQ3L462_9LILI|nr:hypothetical protein Cni_G26639 [Canna indica]
MPVSSVSASDGTSSVVFGSTSPDSQSLSVNPNLGGAAPTSNPDSDPVVGLWIEVQKRNSRKNHPRSAHPPPSEKEGRARTVEIDSNPKFNHLSGNGVPSSHSNHSRSTNELPAKSSMRRPSNVSFNHLSKVASDKYSIVNDSIKKSNFSSKSSIPYVAPSPNKFFNLDAPGSKSLPQLASELSHVFSAQIEIMNQSKASRVNSKKTSKPPKNKPKNASSAKLGSSNKRSRSASSFEDLHLEENFVSMTPEDAPKNPSPPDKDLIMGDSSSSGHSVPLNNVIVIYEHP